MTDRDPAHILNDATTQIDRLLGAPEPVHVDVDGRSLADLILFAARYGALIDFYDLENRMAGNWEGFFAQDPSVVAAMHAALDFADIERNCRRLLADLRAAKGRREHLAALRRLLAALARLIGVLDEIYVPAGDAEALFERFASHERTDAIGEPLARLQVHIGAGPVERAVTRGIGHGPHWWTDLCDLLDDLVATLLVALRDGAAEAQERFDVSLREGDHAPQAALYNAFAILFAEARAELNLFPERMMRFYYGQVLEQTALAPQPDTLFLTFTRTPGAPDASVPQFTLFPAGSDPDGQPINYSADSALEVTPAAVAEISIHRVVHQTHGVLPVPVGVLSGIVAIDPDRPAAPTPFPMFGTDEPGPSGALDMQPATIGFCLASPLLMLLGGTRTVVVDLCVSLRRPAGGELAHDDDTAMLAALTLAVETGLALHYSTAGGWIPVEHIGIRAAPRPGTDSMIFTIDFTLPPDAPAMQPLDAKAPPGTPPPSLPANAFPGPPGQPVLAANVAVDWNKPLVAFPLLSLVWFDQVTLDVQVTGLSGLTLTTPNGPADTSQNFALFGLPPTQGASVDIHAPELFVKPLDTLSVAIDWVGLPITQTGFEGYYRNYVIDADGVLSPTPLFDNASFRVAFSAVNPGYWGCDATDESYLFQTGVPSAVVNGPPPTPISVPYSSATPLSDTPDPAAVVAPSSILHVPLSTMGALPAYYTTKSSALRLTLTRPSYAFGNLLYSNNLMYASQQAVPPPSGSGQSAPSPASAVLLDALAVANAASPDGGFRARIEGAVFSAVAALAADAVKSIKRAIGESDAASSTKSGWFQDIEAMLSGLAGEARSLWKRFAGKRGALSDVVALVERLIAWIGAHEHSLGHDSAALGDAKAQLATAASIATAHRISTGQSPADARATIATAVRQAQGAPKPTILPNPPWLPVASALSISYSASLTAPLDMAFGHGSAPTSSAGSSYAHPLLSFWHIAPFDALQQPNDDPIAGASLLPQIDNYAALYIRLSAPVSPVSLLFTLSAGPDGWWSDPPSMIWEERIDHQWQPCAILDDGTDMLKNSGVITLCPTIVPGVAKAPRLRVRASHHTHKAPIVQSVIANAVRAHWAGPGGASGLGVPLPAGSITKSAAPLAGIASIAQPMQSFGGSPPSVGRDFDKWMAERLRHKGFAIDAWDHARLALQAAPSLMQVAVVPAVDEKTGRRAAGKLWVVLVAGPATPNVVDATVPQADLSTLSGIGEMLYGVASPFIKIAVTNPPYRRLTVEAVLEFDRSNTASFWIEGLQKELVAWLSPWPQPDMAARPKDYYTRRAVAEFVRHRPYVVAIITLDLHAEPDLSGHGYCYFTSALTHDISTANPKVAAAWLAE